MGNSHCIGSGSGIGIGIGMVLVWYGMGWVEVGDGVSLGVWRRCGVVGKDW